jgi:hypothetical protein
MAAAASPCGVSLIDHPETDTGSYADALADILLAAMTR